jgi:hypothetical protein
MAANKTYTYQLAKDIFNTASLKEDNYLSIYPEHISIFRKHLSELIKRKQSNARFTSRYLLDKNQLLVIRIK